ncbi:TPA: hypothetical protein ACUNF5_005268 [Burkholderia orbicola]
MFSLILVVYVSGAGGGITSQTIDGFPDGQACEVARTLSVAAFSQTTRATGVCVYKGRLQPDKR